MSGVLSNPYEVGSPASLANPDLDELNKLALHKQALLASGVPVGLVASLLPDPNATGAASVIPLQGAAAGAVGALHAVDNFTNRLTNFITPSFLQPAKPIPQATPLYDWADRVSNATDQQALNIVPHVAPQNADDEAALRTGEAVGAMGFPVPGVAASKLLRPITALLPGIHGASAPLIAGGITSAVSNLADSGSDNGQAQTVTIPVDDQQPPTSSVDPNALPVPPIPPASVPPITRVSDLAAPHTVSVPMEVTIPFDAMNHPDNAMSWKEAALYGGGALAVLVAGPRILRMVEDLTGNTRAARYRDASLPFNTQQADTAAGAIPFDDARIPAPLPGVAGDRMTGAAEAIADRNARINAYTNATSQSPTVAKQLRAQTGLINNDQAFDARLQNIATTGEDPVSGLRMPSPVEHWTKVANLSDDQQALYNQARYASNELDNRVINARSGTNQPLIPVNFSSYDDASLKNYVTQAHADPAVKDLLDEMNLISTAKMHIAEARGMLSSEDVGKILRDHPNYLADADINGLIENPFSSRTLDPNSGFESALHPAWELDKQHLETFYRALEQNELRRNVVQTAYTYQADPQVAQIFRPSQDASGAWVAGKDTIPVRINGELQYHHVAHPALREALDQSPGATNAVIGGLNALRNASQSSITGTAAMVAGHFFAPLNAARSAMEGAIIRPTGAAGGYLDKGLQMVTGGRLGLPGDPTAVLTMPYEWLAGAGSEGSKALASILDPAATNSVNTTLRSVLGNSVVDAMHTRMQAVWDNSIRAEMEKAGAMNAAGMSSTPIPSHQMGAAEHVFSPINNLVPQLFRINGPLGSAMPTFVRLNNLANMVKSIVGEAAHEQFYRLNSQLTPEQRAFETRQLTGDPGTHGKSAIIRGYGAVSDYANIAIQDFMRVARAFKEQPATTALGLLVGLGVPAMAEIFSAMLHGEDAINHMANEQSNREGASDVRIYIPGQPPEQAMKFPLAINMRVFYPIMKQAIMDVISLQSHSHDESVSQWAMDGMRDFFAKHITQSTVDQSIAGLSTAVSPPIPSIIPPTITALTGKTVDPTLDSAYQMIDQFPNLPRMFSHDIAGDPRAPGRSAGGDSLTGSVGGNIFKNVISNTFGYVSSAVTSALTTFENANRATHDPTYAMGNVVQDYKDRLQESLPFLNGVLWNHDDRLATQTPLVQRVNQSLDAMRPFANWKSDMRWEGLTRAHGLPLPGVSNVPTDPTLQQVYATTGAYAHIIETKMMPQIQDVRKQMSALSSSPLSPEAVRTLRNQYVRDLQSKYEDVAGLINDANDHLSQIVGKHITVTDVASMMKH